MQNRKSLRVEAAGLAYLKLRLLQAGYEVAVPDFDNGIDLIAFQEPTEVRPAFKAWPIQLKSATAASFGVHSKYQSRDIYYAFVWNVFSTPELFILSYQEALIILGEKKANTPSFRVHGAYDTTSPSREIKRDLEPFSKPEAWFQG
jgi:hypothetical protein